MSVQEVYINVPVVRDMAKNFGRIGILLQGISKTLEALIITLKIAAFIGRVSVQNEIQYFETLRPYIEKLSQKCTELNSDLDASVDAYERGDELGATRFY